MALGDKATSAGYCVVRAVSGTTPGPQSDISYTVDYYGSDGTSFHSLPGIVPVCRQTEDDVDIYAARVGSGWAACIAGDRLMVFIVEKDASGVCE